MRVLVVSNYTLLGTSLVVSLQNSTLGEPVEAQLCQKTRVSEVARAWSPDVILIEATLDFAGAISTLYVLIREVPEARIVLLGTEGDDATIFEAVLGGADGYLTGDTSLETLVSTLKGVAQGELGLSSRAARQVIHQLRQTAHVRPKSVLPKVESSLTPREQEVFELVRRGLRSREIAQELTIADATVYKHIQNILDKLRVHSRTQAIFQSGSNDDGAEPPVR
ncbi:MAG TPA: response regulator transcription factor [Ktedonobacterales bacterium]